MNNSDAYDTGAGAGSAGGAAGAVGGAGVAGAAGAAGSKLPLRGLAMVLISVAILLGLWGIFALTSSDETTATNTANNAQESAANGGEGANGSGNKAGDKDGRGDGHNGAPADGDRREGDHADGDHADAEHADGAHPDAAGHNGEAGMARDGARPEGAPAPGERRQGAGGAGAGSGAGGQQTFDVTVLNNSTVSGLAHRVTESLEREGQKTRESGNLPGGEKVLRENTVFFPAGNAAAEQRARELAERVGGVARENMDYLPREATDNNGLTMVLIGEVSI